MKYFIFSGLFFFFIISCKCKKQLEPFNIKKPVIYPNTYVDLYDRKRFKIGITIQGNPSETIQLPNDSIVHIIGIDFDGDSTMLVREGSEFFYAQNKYRVNKVITEPIWVDGLLQNTSKGMYLQLLETPKHCKCQNRRLKAFDKNIRNIDIDSLLSN